MKFKSVVRQGQVGKTFWLSIDRTECKSSDKTHFCDIHEGRQSYLTIAASLCLLHCHTHTRAQEI